MKNSQVAQRSLEIQVGQIQQVLNTRTQGGLPADTENPKQVMTITLRNGKEL